MKADVIVVGAGSAGATLASRLSEDPDRRVVLLETGPDHRSADTPDGIRGGDFWQACATPGRIFDDLLAVHADGQDPAIYLRGRGVGGSSAVNAMVALRGIPEDYDHWSRDLGCTGWSWEDLLPWFLAAEDDAEFGGDDLHGKGGPIPLHRLATDEWSALDRALLTATNDLGYPWCPDYHGPGAHGYGPAALTIRDGNRVSTNDAYLEPARARPNLTIRGNVVVDRILFDNARHATGVRTADGEELTAPTVVLSAGTIHSPAVLLRSGVTDRPVGENLIEHPLLPLLLPLNGGAAGDRVRTVSAMLRYTSGLADAGPVDMQVLPLATFGAGPPLTGIAGIGVSATRVFSRGRVSLADSSPTAQPRVEFSMLSDPRDRERMRDGFHRAVALASHPAVAGLAEAVLAGETPLAELEDPASLDAWMDATVTNYVHSVGTCRMGDPADPAAVVDLWCRLIGYEGTYVVDASVMPDMPRANVHLTTVAIAERVADHLRRQ